MKRYSLANYIVSIEPADQTLKSMFGTISLGGQGSYLGQVSVQADQDLFTTKGFATGAWVHDKNLSKVGKVNIDLHQLANEVVKLIKLCSVYYSGDYNGCTISISDANANKVATCEDCYIQKYADQQFGEESTNQSWTFTCGKVNFLQ